MTRATPVVGILYARSIQNARGNPPSDSGDLRPAEPALCRELSLAAEKTGILVYAFEPGDFNGASGELHALCLQGDHFIRTRVPLPDFIFDRRFPTSLDEKRKSGFMLEQMGNRKAWKWLNGSLPSKTEVMRRLAVLPQLAPLLPPFSIYRSASALLNDLNGAPQGLVLKPSAGMQGRGVIRIKQLLWNEGYEAMGKSRGNNDVLRRFADADSFSAFLNETIRHTPYLVQPYLTLRNADRQPYDIRALAQKGGDGVWELTGVAARVGAKGGLTSNLHGGGKAHRASHWLEAQFGTAGAAELLERISKAALLAVRGIEASFGRFSELALDFGIEPSGKIWLLEANAKPGRQVFRLIGDGSALKSSALRPLLYARYLSGRFMPALLTKQSASGRTSRRAIPLLKGAAALNVQEVHR